MRIDTTSLDEKALSSSSTGPYPILRHLRELIKTQVPSKKEEGADQEMSSASQQEERDQEFMEEVKKLVDLPNWRVKAFPMIEIGDIFNALGERVEKLKELGPKVNLVLRAMLIIATNTIFDAKTLESQSSLAEIIKSGEDMHTVSLVMEIMHQMKLKYAKDNEEKILSYALGFNQYALTQSTSQAVDKNYFTLLETEVGVNNHNVNLTNSEIEFEILIEPEGLNERHTTKHITVPMERIANKEKTAAQISREIAAENGKSLDRKFYIALETKIIWRRLLENTTEETKKKDLTQALNYRLNALGAAFSINQDHITPDFVRYAKDNFLNECLELLQKSSSQEVQLKAASILSRISARDRSLIQVESLGVATRVNQHQSEEENKEGAEDEMSTPVILQMIDDIAGIQLFASFGDMNSSGVEVKCQPTYFNNSAIVCNNEFQESIINVAWGVIRGVMAQQVRTQQEIVQQLSERYLKIVSQLAVNNTYCYNLRVVSLILSMLKYVLKPRFEEQLNYVEKLEHRLVFELENWQSKFFYYSLDTYTFLDREEVDQKDRQSVIKAISTIIDEQIIKDVQGSGIVRKVLESKIITVFEQLLDLNNEQSASLVDSLIPKYTHLIGSIAQSSPESISSLLKNNHLQKLLGSLDQRIPMDKEAISSLMYCLGQISLNTEVQENFLKPSKLFEKVVMSSIEGGTRSKGLLMTGSNEGRDLIAFRNSISHYLDRSPVFVEQAKVLVKQLIGEIKDLTVVYYKKCRALTRKQSQLTKEEYKKELALLKDDPLITERVLGGVLMLFSIGVTSPNQERQQQVSRHSIDIFSGEIFKGIMDLFELLSQIPYNYTSNCSSIMMRLFKHIIEQQNFQDNLIEYSARFRGSFEDLRQMFGAKLPKLRTLAHLIHDEQKVVEPLEQYNGENNEVYLTQMELFQTNLSRCGFYIKSFFNLSSATKLMLNSQYSYSIDIKTLFYLENAFNYDRAAHVGSLYEQLLKEKDSQETEKSELWKQYGEAFLQRLEENEEEVKQEQQKLMDGVIKKSENKENRVKVRDFLMVNYLDNNSLESLNRQFKELQVQEFITKINALCQNQSQRRQQLRQLEITKNMGVFLGKTLAKLTKPFRQSKLKQISLDSPFKNLFEYLFLVDNNLGVLQQGFANNWFEGESFYQFYKSGGLSNLADLFNWFKDIMENEQVIGKDQATGIVTLFDGCCSKLCLILNTVAQFKGIDGQQTFIQITMTNEYDNVRHFFSNVYYTICSKILQIEANKEVEGANPLIKLYNERSPQMHELILQLLLLSSQGFPQCPYLKDSAQAVQRNRDGQRVRGQPQPDQQVVANLEGMGFSRDRVLAVLLQTSDINQATNILLEQSMSIGAANDFDFLGRGAQSSDESDIGGDQIELNAAFNMEEQTQKASVEEFKKQQSKVQEKGFGWVIEAQEMAKIKKNKAQQYISNILSNEKDPNAQKDMFNKVCGFLKKSLKQFKEKVLEPLKTKQTDQMMIAQDQQQINTSSFAEEAPLEIAPKKEDLNLKVTAKLQQDLQLFQKIILKDKVYAKNSIKLDMISHLASALISLLDSMKLIKNKSTIIREDQALFSQIQSIALDLELTVFVMIQYLFIVQSAYDDKLKKEVKKEDQKYKIQIESKVQEYLSKLHSTEIFSICSQFIELSYELQKSPPNQDMSKIPLYVKKPLITLSLCILMKILSQAEQTPLQRQELSKQAFSVIEKLWIAGPVTHSALIDQKLIQSVAILCFQSMKQPQSMFTNIIDKVLIMNYEDAKSRKKDNKEGGEKIPEHTISETNYKGFLSFFKSLSSLDQESFIAATSESCLIKAQKKDNKILQDSAKIFLKEKPFTENLSRITKERNSFSQLTKQFDIYNDQSLKKTIKQSRKQLLKQLDPEQKTQFTTLLQILNESTSSQFADTFKHFEEKPTAKAQLSQSEEQIQINTDSNPNKGEQKAQLQMVEPQKFLDFIAKLTQAYPASTVMILQSHQYGTSKKGFVQWFIQDFLFGYLIHKKPVNLFQAGEININAQENRTYEYSIVEGVSHIEQCFVTILNNLTGFNHLMTFSEQVVKYELRTKFILESLLILQKAIKTKKVVNPIKQRCQIIACLIVIEALTNFKGQKQTTQKYIATENYYNSIRSLIYRGEKDPVVQGQVPVSTGLSQQIQSKEEKVQKLPSSVIKTLQDLLSDKIDIQSKNNADIIKKCVSILKLASDFFYNQKKKAQKKRVSNEEAKIQVEGANEENKQEENKQLVNNEDIQMSDSDEEQQHLQDLEGNQIMAAEQDDEDDEAGDDQDEENDGEDGEDDQQDGEEDEDDEDDEDAMEDEEINLPGHQHIHIVDDGEDDENVDDDLDLIDNAQIIQEDDHSESDEEQLGNQMIWGGARIGERRPGQAVADIINIQDREELIEMIGLGRRPQPGGARPQQQQEWSEEESQVNYILNNLRASLLQQARRDPNRALAARDRAGERIGGVRQAEALAVNPKVNILDQMFEGIRVMDAMQLFETAFTQKTTMEQELQIEEELMRKPALDLLLNAQAHNNNFQLVGRGPADLNRDEFQEYVERQLLMRAGEEEVRGFDMQARGIEDQIPAANWGGMFQRGWGARNEFEQPPYIPNVLNDPLFARPPIFGDQNFSVFGNQNAINPAQDPAIMARQMRMVTGLAQPDLSEQLLERVQIEVEEVKVEDKKILQNAFAMSGSSSSNQSPNQILLDEVEGERRRVEEMGRINNADLGRQREQMDRQQDDLRRQGELFQALSQVNLGGILEFVDQNAPQIPIPGGSPRIVEQIQAQSQNNEIIPQQQQIEAASQHSQNEEMKNEEVKQEDQVIEQQPIVQQEQVQSEQQVEEVKQEEQPAASNKTFGYDNDFLIENGIDPDILSELPEEMRVELLSSLDIQPIQEANQQNVDNAQAQPIVSDNQLGSILANALNGVQVEEQKQEDANQQPGQAQQQQPNAQNQPEYMQLAVELGLDPTFLENIPEEYRRDIIENELRNRGGAQPQRQAENMDVASFIASVTDPRLRQEIFAGLDEATIATLPPNLLAEARIMGDAMRQNRQRAREQQERMANPNGGLRHIQHQIDMLERRLRGEDADVYNRYIREPGQNHALQIDTSLEAVVLSRHRVLADEMDTEDIEQIIACQLNSDERLIEALILILTTNDSVECDLLPTLCSLMKIQGASNLFVMRNKIINAITYLLKIVSLNDEECINILLPGVQINKRKIILILIGSLRIIIKNNRKLVRHILRSLLNKEDYFKPYGTNVLKKQQKALALKQNGQTVQPPLSEIFQLVRAPIFKNDKVLMKNLSMFIHQVIKQFDSVLEEMGMISQQISKDTIESLGEVLQLEIIDSNMINALGEFLFQMSKKKKENYSIISEFCEGRSLSLLEKLNSKLEKIPQSIDQEKLKLSPSKSDYMSSPMHIDDQHLIIDTGSALSSKSKVLKLSEEEERTVKQSLKLKEDSEALLRIFKLFNQFYSKFKEIKEALDLNPNEEYLKPVEVTENIIKFYNNEHMELLGLQMNDILRIVQNANIELTESVINLIFCIFASYFPEIYDQINKEEKRKEEEKKEAEEAKLNPNPNNQVSNKFKILMTPIQDSLTKQGAETFNVFRNVTEVTPRIKQLSDFSYKNRRIINKIIKQKNNMFTNEMEGAIKHMSNILDFENKRTYFKSELQKVKKSQYFDQIQLSIRRDNIFMDAFAQLSILSADQMKNRLHISFINERGQDAGGLTRDFFIELSRQMFNPNYSLFNLSSSGSTYYPNPKSYVEKDHLKYFKFIGRVIGKALFDECLLECYFVKTLYKIVIGEPLSFLDIEDYDNEFFNNLKWCLNNDISTMGQSFYVEQDYFGKIEEIELVPGGKNIAVNNENKFEYVEKFAYFKLYSNISKQVDAFLEGFYELIPKDLVSIFNHKELELLISGLPYFDIADLKQNTEYQGYSATSPQVVWLFEILESFDNSERAEFLQFVTGSSKIPLDGFKGLMGMRGPQNFTVAKVATEDAQRLPSGHTCFNQIDIPEYPSKEIMHERVLTAIKETKGFGFA